MYKVSEKMKRSLLTYRIIVLLALLIAGAQLFAQTPTHYPTGENRVDFNFVNILIYIVFPVLLVVIWILIRKRKPQD